MSLPLVQDQDSSSSNRGIPPLKRLLPAGDSSRIPGPIENLRSDLNFGLITFARYLIGDSVLISAALQGDLAAEHPTNNHEVSKSAQHTEGPPDKSYMERVRHGKRLVNRNVIDRVGGRGQQAPDTARLRRPPASQQGKRTSIRRHGSRLFFARNTGFQSAKEANQN
jgi:hypothetical protein